MRLLVARACSLTALAAAALVALAPAPARAGGQDLPGEEPEFAPTQPPAPDEATPAPAPAEEAPPPPGALPRGKGARILGADAVLAIPFGDWAGGDAGDFVTIAAGAFARITYGVNAKLAVTGRLGFVYNVPAEEGLSFIMVPLLGGVTYDVTPKVFLYGELGLNYLRTSVDVYGTDTSFKLNAGFGGGYRLGRLDGRVGIWMPGAVDTGTVRTLWGIQASVGYDFMAL